MNKNQILFLRESHSYELIFKTVIKYDYFYLFEDFLIIVKII